MKQNEPLTDLERKLTLENKELKKRLKEAEAALDHLATGLNNEIALLREAEHKLQNSEHIMRYFLDTVPIGVIKWGVDGIIQDANDQYLEMTGFSKEDLVERRINWIRLSPGYTQRDKEASEEYLTTGKCYPYEKVTLRKDGSLLPVIISSVMVDPGNKDGIAFIIDISDQKKKEEALYHSQRLLEEAERIANLGSWEYDIRSGTVTWSDNLYRIFHQDPLTYTPTLESLFCQIHADDRSKVQVLVQKALEEEKGCSSNYRILLDDGTIRHISSLCQVRHDANGFPERFVGTSIDVTMSKEDKKIIEYQAHLINNVSDAVIASDKDYRIAFWNRGAEKIYGWKSEEVTGLNGPQLLQTRFVNISRDEAIRKGIEIGEYEAEVIHKHKNGKDIPIESYFRVLKDETGLVTDFISVNRDISERKKYERDLNQLIRTLSAMQKSSLLMVLATDEKKFLQDACRIIIEDCGHKMVWIGYKENDHNKSVKPVAYAGFEEKYLESLKITWDDTLRGQGPTGTAIRTGKPALCRNMQTDPAFEPWRKEALQRGYSSSIVLPLAMDNEIFGVMNIYSRDPDPFSEDEQRLLSKLADDLAYGVKTIRMNLALQQAKENLEVQIEQRTNLLKKSMLDLDAEKKRFQDVLNLIPVYIALITPDHKIKFSNQVFREYFGEIGDKPCFNLLYGATDVCRHCKIEEITATGKPAFMEISGPGSRIFQVSDFPYTDSDGNFLILEMGIDITEKKNIEKLIMSKILETEEKERSNFASDLHDDLGPTLSAIRLQLNLLANEQAYGANNEVFNICDELLSESIEKIRNLANNIMPGLIESYGLESSVRSFTSKFEKTCHIHFQFNSSINDLRFNKDAELHMYRVVTELINNTIKHSGAKNVLIEMKNTDNILFISYSDDGIGYHVGKIEEKTAGIGLQNILNRVNLLDGTIRFARKNEKTIVEISIPIQING